MVEDWLIKQVLGLMQACKSCLGLLAVNMRMSCH